MKLLFLAPLVFNKPYSKTVTPFSKFLPLFSCTESEEECFIDIVEQYQENKNTFVDYDNVTWSFQQKTMKYYDPQDKIWIEPIVKKKFKPELI